jgi:acetate kinase
VSLVLTVNAGSSSVRLALHRAQGRTLDACAGVHHDRDAGPPVALLRDFIAAHATAAVDLVAHRVVHGGPRFGAPQRIDGEVESEIERLSALAPLHHPAALAWIHACRDEFGAGVEQVAVFDTAFHAGLPATAAGYALPHALAERHGLRRYGFHGIAHRALWSRWCTLRPDLPDGGRLVTLQLGAGCSVCAIERGRSVDTSMGYSPLEGLMMATRCGDVDPAVLIALQREAGLAPAEVERLLATQSGLLGVSGLSADMRVLLASDDARSRLAVDMFCHRARKVLGAYLAVLRGADGIVFGGGIGENAPAVRERILDVFEWAGLALDAAANAACAGREACISRADSRIQVWVVPVDEASELATQALSLRDTP